MVESTIVRAALRAFTGVVMLFIYLPLVILAVYAFNASPLGGWPPSGFTTEWWGRAIESEGVRAALWTSVWVAVIATLVALVLGTLLSFALGRYRFFGRESISLLVILPIALPGIGRWRLHDAEGDIRRLIVPRFRM